MQRDRDLIWLIVIAALVWWAARGSSIVGPTTEVSAVAFVYEKSEHPVPGAVSFALDKLNREHGIEATVFDQHVVDGTGQTPEQYVVALTAAREAGLPALVVLSGPPESREVVRVVKNPKTEADVLEAVK